MTANKSEKKDACGERPAVGIDDTCSKWEPIEEGH